MYIKRDLAKSDLAERDHHHAIRFGESSLLKFITLICFKVKNQCSLLPCYRSSVVLPKPYRSTVHNSTAVFILNVDLLEYPMRPELVMLYLF